MKEINHDHDNFSPPARVSTAGKLIISPDCAPIFSGLGGHLKPPLQRDMSRNHAKSSFCGLRVPASPNIHRQSGAARMRQLGVITAVLCVCGRIGFVGPAVVILPEYRHPSHMQHPYTAPIV